MKNRNKNKSFSTKLIFLSCLLFFGISSCNSSQSISTPNVSEMAVDIASTLMAMTAQTPTFALTAVPVVTEVQNLRVKLDESGRLVFSGYVVNNGSQPIQGIGIKLILKDKNGDVSSEKFDLVCYIPDGDVSSEKFDLVCYIPVGGKSPFVTVMGYGELDYSGGISVEFGKPVFASQEMIELANSLDVITTDFLDYGNGQGEIYGTISNIGDKVIPYPMIGGYLIDNNGFVETMITNGGGMVIEMNGTTLLSGETFKFIGTIETPNPSLPNLSPIAYLAYIPMPNEVGICGLVYTDSGEFIPIAP